MTLYLGNNTFRRPFYAFSSASPGSNGKGFHTSSHQLDLSHLCHCSHSMHPTNPAQSTYVEPRSERV